MRVDEELLQLTTIAQLAQEEDERPHCGSVVGRQVIFRDRYAGFFHLMQDYFGIMHGCSITGKVANVPNLTTSCSR
jgi:hypothetical protein